MTSTVIRLERQRAFAGRYEAEYPEVERLAGLVERYVRSLLQGLAIDMHLVSSRAKIPSSVREKIRRKSYGNPGRQLTDKIGVRVITYYGRDVDAVVERLGRGLVVDVRNSVDKRHALGVREFGYRSVQLVAEVPRNVLKRLEFRSLRGVRFEVQVRSILEHAWAEIEHEIVYKSRIDYPVRVLRSFAAIAGTLEILEGEFLALKRQKGELVEAYRVTYLRGADVGRRFDAARLLGFLESQRPEALSWRRAEEEGRPFPQRIDATCVEALLAAGLSTARSLGKALRDPGFRQAVASYAASQGLEPRQVSHLALVLIAIARKSPRVFDAYFPDFLGIQEAAPRPTGSSRRH